MAIGECGFPTSALLVDNAFLTLEAGAIARIAGCGCRYSGQLSLADPLAFPPPATAIPLGHERDGIDTRASGLVSNPQKISIALLC